MKPFSSLLLLILFGCNTSSLVIPTSTSAFTFTSTSLYWKIHKSDSEDSKKEADVQLALVIECTKLPYPEVKHDLFLDETFYTANGACITGPDGACYGGFYIQASQEVHVIGDIAFSQSWRHEMLHLLLDLNKNDPDSGHVSPLWGLSCV